jgi:SpoIIAA-like
LQEREAAVLERISDMPDSVVGIRASGEVTGDDYRNVLIPAVEAALEAGHKVRLLYVLGEDMKGLGFTAGAALQDTKFGLGHYSSWERVAVVCAKEWLRHSVDILGYLIPGEVKAFSPAEETEARAWVSS